MLTLREQGKQPVESVQITGYAGLYVATTLRRLQGALQMLEGMSRGGRPQGSLRGVSAKDKRRARQ